MVPKNVGNHQIECGVFPSVAGLEIPFRLWNLLQKISSPETRRKRGAHELDGFPLKEHTTGDGRMVTEAALYILVFVRNVSSA